MSLRRRPVAPARELALGTLLGALAALLLTELGAYEWLGLERFGPYITTLIAIGIILGALGWLALIAGVDAFLLLVYLIVCFTPIMDKLAPRWVRNDDVANRKLDAVVVLSGYVKSDTALEAVAVERLIAGMELVKAKAVPRLITTRVVADVDGVRIVSDEGQRKLIQLADLESRWTEVDSVGTTRDEAKRVAALLLPGAPSVAVVTSPMHTRRACETFEAVGFRVRCVATQEMKSITWHPTGAADRLASFRDYVYERLGTVKYRYKGWMMK